MSLLASAATDHGEEAARLNIHGRKITVRGVVQGVGFRPFVYSLANEHGLAGWVRNSTAGVEIEIEGTTDALAAFKRRLIECKPLHAVIHEVMEHDAEPRGQVGFQILPSEVEAEGRSLILPDLATCPDCLAEILDPADRRHRHPFANCTQCGPRFSVIESLPYDRVNTSMRVFEMCAACRSEYQNAADRRFHAQPVSCPACGPQIALHDPSGQSLAERDEALVQAAKIVRDGGVLALKGLGGFHLVVDARNEAAVANLRERKRRPMKPFAVMVPDIAMARQICDMSDDEIEILQAPQAPIVLVGKRRSDSTVAASVAPDNPRLGVMLSYTPLHHLLLHDLGFPVIATSGNLAGEPICIDSEEAFLDLAEIADVFLIHDRPILRAVDDSVAMIACGQPMLLRRARGYAPLPIRLSRSCPASTLAFGADLKNTVAITRDRELFVSQHIGDLGTEKSLKAQEQITGDLPKLLGVKVERTACDRHPDYPSSRTANQTGFSRPIRVQHHHAHVAACMVEHGLKGPALGVSWDGTGYGDDESIWGGEFLKADIAGFERLYWLHPFPLPGGEKAIKEPRWAAFGLLRAVGGDMDDLPLISAFTGDELRLGRNMLEKQVNCPMTSSAGRLFDAVAAILGLRLTNSFEGEAAMQLEFAADESEVPSNEVYPIELGATGAIDWRPMLKALMDDVKRDRPVSDIAAVFHNAMSECIVRVARQVNLKQVVVSGGCFQNRRLLEGVVARLANAGFEVRWPQALPPNDGGIAAGQAVIAGMSRAD